MTTQQITLNDQRRLAYSEYGDRDGRPLFYFHGMPASRLEAVLLEAAASRLGLRIIAADRPGFDTLIFSPAVSLM
ncbi:MAG: hypothetical protein R3E89_07250 [Thiolinea sp.]